jgi:hypothetical protein
MSPSDASSKYNLIALRRRMNIARCGGVSASASTFAQVPVSIPRTPPGDWPVERDPTRDDFVTQASSDSAASAKFT